MVIGIYRDFRISTLNSCLMTAVTLVICAVSGLGAGGIFRIMVSYTICAMIIGIKREFCVAALCNLFTVVTNSVSAVSCFGAGACNSFNLCCINVILRIKREFCVAALYNLFTVVTDSVSAVSCNSTGACSSLNLCCINMVIRVNSDILCLCLLTYRAGIGLGSYFGAGRSFGLFALVPAMLSAYRKSIGLLCACRFICNLDCVLNSSLTGNVNICYRCALCICNCSCGAG